MGLKLFPASSQASSYPMWGSSNNVLRGSHVSVGAGSTVQIFEVPSGKLAVLWDTYGRNFGSASSTSRLWLRRSGSAALFALGAGNITCGVNSYATQLGTGHLLFPGDQLVCIESANLAGSALEIRPVIIEATPDAWPIPNADDLIPSSPTATLAPSATATIHTVSAGRATFVRGYTAYNPGSATATLRLWIRRSGVDVDSSVLSAFNVTAGAVASNFALDACLFPGDSLVAIESAGNAGSDARIWVQIADFSTTNFEVINSELVSGDNTVITAAQSLIFPRYFWQTTPIGSILSTSYEIRNFNSASITAAIHLVPAAGSKSAANKIRDAAATTTGSAFNCYTSQGCALGSGEKLIVDVTVGGSKAFFRGLALKAA